MSSDKMVRISEHYYVPEQDLIAHQKRMALENETAGRKDVMTPKEEEEWNISLGIRNGRRFTGKTLNT